MACYILTADWLEGLERIFFKKIKFVWNSEAKQHLYFIKVEIKRSLILALQVKFVSVCICWQTKKRCDLSFLFISSLRYNWVGGVGHFKIVKTSIHHKGIIPFQKIYTLCTRKLLFFCGGVSIRVGPLLKMGLRGNFSRACPSTSFHHNIGKMIFICIKAVWQGRVLYWPGKIRACFRGKRRRRSHDMLNARSSHLMLERGEAERQSWPHSSFCSFELCFWSTPFCFPTDATRSMIVTFTLFFLSFLEEDHIHVKMRLFPFGSMVRLLHVNNSIFLLAYCIPTMAADLLVPKLFEIKFYLVNALSLASTTNPCWTCRQPNACNNNKTKHFNLLIINLTYL